MKHPVPPPAPPSHQPPLPLPLPLPLPPPNNPIDFNLNHSHLVNHSQSFNSNKLEFNHSRPTSSNGNHSHQHLHQSRLIDSSPDSSLGSNAPPPYHPTYNQPHYQSTYPNHLHPPPLHSPDSRTQLFVGNLPFRVRWQDLKDLFRKAGTVLRADVCLTSDNRSKGFGTVLFANGQDALKAIEIYNGFSWQTRTLDVRLDQQDPAGTLAMNCLPSTTGPLHHPTPHRLPPSITQTSATPNQLFHPTLLNPARPLPPPISNWPPGLPPPHLPTTSNLDALVQPTTTLSLNSSSASEKSLHQPTTTTTTLDPPGLSKPLGIRLAHQQHQSAQSLTCDDLIRSSSARLPDGTVNKLSCSLPHPPPRRSSAVSSNPPHVLDALRPAFHPLSASLDNPSHDLGAHTLMNELAKIPTEDTTEDTTTTTLSSEHGPDDDHPHSIHSQHSFNPVPSIVYPYYPTASSTAMSSSSSNGIGTVNSGQQVPPHSASGVNVATRHLFVGNLPFNCQWQDLKDLFRNAGNILRADVATGVDGRSRGFGTVLFATAEDANNAVKMYDGHEFNGRQLKVHFDKFSHPSISPGPASLEYSPHPQSAPQPYYPYPSTTLTSDQFGQQQAVPSHQYNSSTGYSNYFHPGPPPSAGLELERVSSHNSFESLGLPSPHNLLMPSVPFQAQAGMNLPPSNHLQQQQMNAPYSSNTPDVGTFSIGQKPLLHVDPHNTSGNDLWAPDQLSPGNGFQDRAHNRPPLPPGLPLSPIASRRSSLYKPDQSSHESSQNDQPVTVQPIGHPHPDHTSSTTRPNSIPMPPPYDLTAGGMASPQVPRGIQMTPSMPAFSFQPFPATPPLLPNFFSPGIGPSTPPSSTRGRGHQNRNNGFYSFGVPSTALHPPTPMASGKLIHSPLGFNPLFPPTTDEISNPSTGSEQHVGSNLTPGGLVGNHPDSSRGTSPSGLSDDSRRPAEDAISDSEFGVHPLDDPKASINESEHSHIRSRSRGLAASETGPRAPSTDISPARRMTGIFEPVSKQTAASTTSSQLTPLSNVDWGYSPSGVNSNRRASFFVSPSHFNTQVDSMTSMSTSGHHQHGLGLGSGSYDFTPSTGIGLGSKLEMKNYRQSFGSGAPIDPGLDAGEQLEEQVGELRTDPVKKLLCSDLFDEDEDDRADQLIQTHEGSIVETGMADDQGHGYRFSRWNRTSTLMNEDGSNRRASFDVSSLTRPNPLDRPNGLSGMSGNGQDEKGVKNHWMNKPCWVSNRLAPSVTSNQSTNPSSSTTTSKSSLSPLSVSVGAQPNEVRSIKSPAHKIWAD